MKPPEKKKRINTLNIFFWILPIVFLFPNRSLFTDAQDDVSNLPKTLSESGMPYHKTGKFRSPFANPNWGEPAKVRVGFLLKSITDYNIKEGKFEADFYLSYTSDKPMPPNIKPHFTNGYLQDDDHMNQIANEPTFKFWKYHAVFYSNPDLRNFPFDKQELEIGIEEDDVGIDQITFIPDKANTNLDAKFIMPGWEVLYQESRVVNHYYPDRFDFDDLYYPRYVFRLGISRFATNALFTVYVPAFVIVLVSLSGVLLNINEVDTRINSSAPMLAAAVLFHFTLSQELPATAYLTRADKLMLGVYIGLIINMFSTWAFFIFPEKYSDRIYKIGKWFVPPCNIIIFFMGGIL